MISDNVTKFMALAPLMLPRLLGDSRPEDTEITEESAVLYFSLEENLHISIVMDMLEEDMELSLLYHGTKKDNSKNHHCCFFASPTTERNMFKINLTSDNHEMVKSLTVTIYDSLDLMESDLEADLSAHDSGFDFIQSMTASDVLSLFCTLV